MEASAHANDLFATSDTPGTALFLDLISRRDQTQHGNGRSRCASYGPIR